jgi:hypothetical protein
MTPVGGDRSTDRWAVYRYCCFDTTQHRHTDKSDVQPEYFELSTSELLAIRNSRSISYLALRQQSLYLNLRDMRA